MEANAVYRIPGTVQIILTYFSEEEEEKFMVKVEDTCLSSKVSNFQKILVLRFVIIINFVTNSYWYWCLPATTDQ